MSTKDQYPKRAIHGVPTPVCEWCGKRVRLARMWRQYGTYCSADCQAAGRYNYYRNLLVFSFICIIALVGIISLRYSGYLNIPLSGIVEIMIILVGSFICLCYSGCMTNLGSKVVRQHEESFSGDELEILGALILNVVLRLQTSEGISRKILYENLKASGQTTRRIKLAIEHLLVSGKLCQVDLNHYALCSDLG